MRRYNIIASRVRAAVAVSAVAFMPVLGACGDVKDTLLEAVDPDIIPPVAANSAEGALALYFGALGRLKTITAGTGGEGSTWLFGGLLADEWSTSSTFVQNDETDQRSIQTNNSTVTTMFRQLARARTSSNEAIRYMKLWRETETTRIAELYFVRAFAEMQMASDYCNGTPLSTQDSTGALIFDIPRTNIYVYEASVASADTGLALIPANATGAQELLVRRSLLVTKARALLGLNKVAEAAALLPASAVPTSFTYDLTYATSSGDITLWAQPRSSRRYTVGDSLEGRGRNLLVKNAVPFFSAKDPRVPSTYTVANSGKDTTISQDGLIPSRTTTLWGRSTTVSAVNGLDARLIEAEALLRANDFAGMTAILQTLRNSPPKLGDITPSFTGVAALAVPATRDAAINLYFREKAFWQFGRGYRLGDLRRLIRQYNRTQDQVFPVGPHYRGGNYGTDVNLPVPQAEENNPELGGKSACIDRNA
jgi:starch-binding outer membrane protein, SusD/RagB family